MLFLSVLKFMWFLMASSFLEGEGADGSGSDDGDGNDDSSDDSDDDSSDDDDGDDNDDGSDDIKDPKSKLNAEQAKNDRLTKRLKQEEKARKDMETRLKELEDAGKSDEEKRSARLEELEANDKEKDSRIMQLTAVNALLVHPAITQLPAPRRRLAIKMLESDVEFTDDGNNIDELIEALKTEDPGLLEIKSSDDSDDDDGKDGAKSRPSGKPVGGKKRKDKSSIDEAALIKRFPAINR
jgi:hypothetical protein